MQRTIDLFVIHSYEDIHAVGNNPAQHGATAWYKYSKTTREGESGRVVKKDIGNLLKYVKNLL